MHRPHRIFALTVSLMFWSAGVFASQNKLAPPDISPGTLDIRDHFATGKVDPQGSIPVRLLMPEDLRAPRRMAKTEGDDASRRVGSLLDPCRIMMGRCEGAPRAAPAWSASVGITDHRPVHVQGERLNTGALLASGRLDICEMWDVLCKLL